MFVRMTASYSLLKTYARMFGEAREGSYIYTVNEARGQIKPNKYNMSVKTKNQLNKVVLDVVTEVKVDGRKNNPGRPVNKQSARYKRLAKQARYERVLNKFTTGSKFSINKEANNGYYKYSPNNDGKLGCIVNATFGNHVCNVSYIGRTKVQGYTYVLDKRVNVELNLKTLQFVK